MSAAAEEAYLALALIGQEYGVFLGRALWFGLPVAFILAWWGITQPSWVGPLHIEDLGSLEKEPLIGMPSMPFLVQWVVPMLALALVEPFMAWELHRALWFSWRTRTVAGNAIPRCLALTAVPASLAGAMSAALDSVTLIPGAVAFGLMPLLVTLLRAPLLVAIPLVILEGATLHAAVKSSVRFFRTRPLAILGASLMLLWLALLAEGLVLTPNGIAGCRDCLGTALQPPHPRSFLCASWWRPLTGWSFILPLVPLHALGFMGFLELRRGRTPH